MANLSKERRDRMIAKLEELKELHNDDKSIAALNEIENALREKKFGLVFEEHTESVDELLQNNIPVLLADKERRLCKDSSMPWNFIIEGDNLQALYLLEKTHRNKVDCIYIDPPYNSGARDWKYNNDYVDKEDSYKHSKWLSMMKCRLTIAKRLLNPKDSMLICSIDEREGKHLGCLLEEIFPDAEIQMVTSVINHASVATFNTFNRNNEYIYFVMIGNYTLESIDSSKTQLSGDEVSWDTLRRHNPTNLRNTRPRQFYPIYINTSTNEIEEIGEPIPPEVDRFSVKQRNNCVAVFPVRDNGMEMLWGVIPQELKRRLSKGCVRVGKYEPDKPQQYPIKVLSAGTIEDIDNGIIKVVGHREDGSVIAVHNDNKLVLPKTQWDYLTHDAKTYGSFVLREIFKGSVFSYPKSIYAVCDCLKLCVKNKKNAVIVDFFSGSGTTLHAVNLLNAEDNGKRKCIMVTNNEISSEEEKTLSEQGFKKGDDEWEKLGIARHVTWPRTVCSINGVDINGEKLKGEYLIKNSSNETISLSDGFNANVKYYKCDWIPRKPEEYLLSNALCIHIQELIELQTATEIDGKKNVIIYNKCDYKKYFENESNFSMIENVWVNENIVFNAKEIKKMKEKEFKYIPREFFTQELKEVGEYV